jgi:signal recognition particle receptor subunit beta
MKPTLKVIITSPEPALPTQFVRTLSAIEVTAHERKIPNPLSATREEAVLLLNTGRTEWDDLAVQGIALSATKRYDFTWATLVKETHGAIILLPAGSPADLENVQRLAKLFRRLEVSACLIGVTQSRASGGAGDAEPDVAELKSALDSPYAVVSCRPEDAASVQSTVRALVSLILPSGESNTQATQ